jgi:trk system potassium uptake protein TrkA
MKVIIMGCGRVGEQTARMLVQDGHQVTVIDPDATALARLGPQFKGRTVQGVGFDRNVLIEAGIEHADAFAATSSMDNINIVAARIAHNIFRVPRVVARLFEPRRAEIYRRLGLITISSTTWGAERIRELLTHADLDTVMTFGRGEVVLITIDIPSHLAGRMVKHITMPGETNVVAITRQGQAIMPTLGTEFRAGDVIHIAVHVSAMDRVEALLGLGGGI